MSNKKDGTNFERRFAKALSDKYWVHILKDNANGQPFDVIAIKNNVARAFDCKLCKGDVFRYSRIEVNQHLAFYKMHSRGNHFCYLAICFGSEPNMAYCVRYDMIAKDKNITLKEAKDIADYVIPLCKD